MADISDRFPLLGSHLAPVQSVASSLSGPKNTPACLTLCFSGEDGVRSVVPAQNSFILNHSTLHTPSVC